MPLSAEEHPGGSERPAAAARAGLGLADDDCRSESCKPPVTGINDSLARLLARTGAGLGPVDLPVNNAGLGPWKPLQAIIMAE